MNIQTIESLPAVQHLKERVVRECGEHSWAMISSQLVIALSTEGLTLEQSAEDLCQLFVWRETPQGQQYWSDIYDRFID